MLKIKVAESFLSRFIGLMGKKSLPKETGLLIAPCQSIHMMFMRFSIDAVYVDKNWIIKKIVPNLRTWIGISICTGAWGVIELAAGEAERLNLKVGEKLTAEIIPEF